MIATSYKHDDLTIFCRDLGSFQYIRENFPQNINTYMAPDVVTYLNSRRLGINTLKPASLKKRALVIFRKDDEKILSDSKAEAVRNYLKIQGYEVVESNTKTDVIAKDIVAMQQILRDTIEMFSQYDLVVTDRLHGMVLSIIANVPCIAFDNITRKVSGVYNYIKEENTFVKVFDGNDEDIIDSISSFLGTLPNEIEYKNTYLEKYFDFMIEKTLL